MAFRSKQDQLEYVKKWVLKKTMRKHLTFALKTARKFYWEPIFKKEIIPALESMLESPEIK